jgi:NADH-quinone oxidoreductase subunit F
MEPGEFGKDGRRIPVKQPDSHFTLHIDMAIPAVSQYSDLPFVTREDVELTDWGTFVVDTATQMTTQPGVFAGGDVARGSDVVITAIADGKVAARSIDIYLGGKGILNSGEPIEIPNMHQDEANTIEHERFTMRYLEDERRRNSFDEVAQGFHKLNAIAEAMRCLQCSKR